MNNLKRPAHKNRSYNTNLIHRQHNPCLFNSSPKKHQMRTVALSNETLSRLLTLLISIVKTMGFLHKCATPRFWKKFQLQMSVSSTVS